jgi:uncharacterized protein YegP (UPF0339 family)
MAGKYEIKKTSNRQFHFKLKAGNGATILTSEMYAAKSTAQGGIKSLRKNASTDSR